MLKFHQAPNTFVHQVSLKVQNLRRSLEYYEQVIGLQVIAQSAEGASLSADGVHVLLELIQPGGTGPVARGTTGLYHFALLLPSREDLADVVIHLRKQGVYFGSADHLVSEALYLNDPDGNGIEIYRDLLPSEWTWTESEVQMTVDPLDFADLMTVADGEREWRGLPAGTIMGHIHLHVADLAAAETFYCAGLGFEAVCRYGKQALFISTGNYHHHIGLNTWNGVGAPRPPAKSAGLESFMVVYPDESSRNEALQRLGQLRFACQQQGLDWRTEDPSGNAIFLIEGSRKEE